MCRRHHFYSSESVLCLSIFLYFRYACAFSVSKGGALGFVIPTDSTVHAIHVVICERLPWKEAHSAPFNHDSAKLRMLKTTCRSGFNI